MWCASHRARACTCIVTLYTQALCAAQEVGLITCGRDEDDQGVLALFCSGAAQVCHDVRVVELKGQLVVEEEDGGQEEEEEVEREKRVKESAPWMTMQMEL